MRAIKVDGLEFSVRSDSDAAVVDEVVRRRAYERPRLGFVIREGDRVLDCGAHVGAFSVWAEKKRGALCLGVEASSASFALASENLRANGCASTVIHGAVTPRPGQTRLRLNERTPSRTSAFNAKGEEEVVTNVTMASLLASFRPTVLKLDIEGGEYALLDAGFDLAGLRAIAMEYHFRFDKRTSEAVRRIARLEVAFARSNMHCSIHREPRWRGPCDAPMFFWN